MKISASQFVRQALLLSEEYGVDWISYLDWKTLVVSPPLSVSFRYQNKRLMCDVLYNGKRHVLYTPLQVKAFYLFLKGYGPSIHSDRDVSTIFDSLPSEDPTFSFYDLEVLLGILSKDRRVALSVRKYSSMLRLAIVKERRFLPRLWDSLSGYLSEDINDEHH